MLTVEDLERSEIIRDLAGERDVHQDCLLRVDCVGRPGFPNLPLAGADEDCRRHPVLVRPEVVRKPERMGEVDGAVAVERLVWIRLGQESKDFGERKLDAVVLPAPPGGIERRGRQPHCPQSCRW